MSEAFVCDAVRTPIGRYGGALSKVRADDLAALPIKELMKRNPNANLSDDDYMTKQILLIAKEVQDYIIKNWSIVKMGSTNAQKTLFFSFNKIKN